MGNKEMTVSEFASLGGQGRWKGITKKQRKEVMKKVWGVRVKLDKTKKVLPK